MKQQRIHNLQDFAEKIALQSVYGAMVASTSLNASLFEKLMEVSGVVNFYTLIVLTNGEAEVTICGQKIYLRRNTFLRTSPLQAVQVVRCSSDMVGRLLLIESTFYDSIVSDDAILRDSFALNILGNHVLIELSKDAMKELVGLFSQIERTIVSPHTYKKELLNNLVHLCQIHVNELLAHQPCTLHDVQHKENIFKIFIHLASNHFKQERQISFYANHLSISSTYLSRIVKEVSGNTVNGYLQGFLYTEACKLLRMTDLTMGEIAEELHFSDQAAFSNFFKQRAGISPKAYRK